MSVILVDPAVTNQKFRQELDLWKEHSDHQHRGWLLLDENDSVPSVEVAFLAGVATSVGAGFLPIIVCTIRLTYENYDLWPPSLTFIDVFTRQPSRPHARAFLSTPEGPRDVLIDGHPTTNQPFLCLPGIREYHLHPQHTGDDWLLHRPTRAGSISTICERIWRLMAKNVVGLNVMLQGLPVFPLQAQVMIQVTQGDLGSAQVVAGPINPQGSK
jgi:hypothetical protein